jgi:hypothetical protein
MTMQIQIPSLLVQELQSQAALSGKSPEALVLEAVQDKYLPASAIKSLPFEEWSALLQKTIELHPPVNHELDVSRESIYEGRGE